MKLFTLILLLIMSCQSLALSDSEIKRWQEDINFYAKQLTALHLEPYHSISKHTFEKNIYQLQSTLSQKTENQVLVEMMRLTRSINDGHTSFPLWGKQLHSFPIKTKIIQGLVYVVGTTEEYKHLLGARLVSINNVPIVEVVSQLSAITPFSENAFSINHRVAQHFNKSEVLNGLGIIESEHKASLVLNVKGKKKTYELNAGLNLDFTQSISKFNDSLFKPIEDISDDLWFGASQSKKTVYVKFRRYAPMRKMQSLSEDLLEFINDEQSQNIIIDLRDNYGGDFFVGLKLAQSLVLADSIDWRSGVFVLIDNATFSAAMSNAAQYTQLLNATLVGEPTGARPAGYQDMGQFTLPNSNLDVTYSKRLYRFANANKNAQNKADALYPSVLIEPSINDYINNHDAQLKAIIHQLLNSNSL